MLKAGVGLSIGAFIWLLIYSGMEAWIPATIPVPGSYNTFKSAPIFDFASMGIGEWIMFFVIFILPAIICIACFLMWDMEIFGLGDAMQVILGMTAGIVTSLFITDLLIDWDLREFHGFLFNNYTFLDWMWLLFITIFPSGLGLFGSLMSSSWGNFLVYGVILPIVATIAICTAIWTIVLMVTVITEAPAFIVALVVIVLASITGTKVIRIYIE